MAIQRGLAEISKETLSHASGGTRQPGSRVATRRQPLGEAVPAGRPKHNSILEVGGTGWQVYTLSAARMVGYAPYSRDTSSRAAQGGVPEGSQALAQHGEPTRDRRPTLGRGEFLSQNRAGPECSGIFLNTFPQTTCGNTFD